ncbi:MAG: hydrogenase iron-sulfur subunit [Desulfobacterales bacterium]|nr:MAG: hydrogenase iron-sulfur subunit [Desulfobacterales bacterium]
MMKPAKVLLFTCNWGAYSGLETAGAQNKSYSPNVRPLKVMCLGRLSSGIILKAFECGADGVLLLGCPPGECQYEFGSRRAEEAFATAKELTRLLGYADERLQMDYVAAGDGETFALKVRHFVAELNRAQGG